MRRYLYFGLTIMVGLLVFAGQISAQEEALEEYGVSYPISELGECESFSECRSYCDDPVNADTCVEYAKEKGFYDEEELEQNKETALKRSKVELGCDSEVSCRNLCEQPANYQKCSNFARKYELGGGVVDNPGESSVLNKAKEVLGCNSITSCKAYCEDESHKDECSSFAKSVGLRGGEQKVGPGGCSSEQSCREFCASVDNYKICQSFMASVGGQFSGPGGCSSEESCREFCSRNPQTCSTRGMGENNNPIDMCNRTPSCYWGNNTCNCSSSYKTTNVDPAQECVKYAGCSWLGSSCQCSTPIYTSSNTYNSEEYKNSCISGGCNWKNNSCDCTGTNGPAIECGNKGCSWIGSACQCGTSGSYSGSTGSTSYPGSQDYSSGSTMSREQQEYYCKAGGGTCDWSSGICNCKNYTSTYSPGTYSPSGGSSGGTTTTTTGTSGTGSSGSGSSGSTSGSYTPYPSATPYTTNMSREQQEAGCTSCGGTCSWNGDFCSCNCGSTSSSSTPAPTASVPTATTQPDPYTACINSGGSWAGNQCYPAGSGVQGVSAAESILDWLLRLFSR